MTKLTPQQTEIVRRLVEETGADPGDQLIEDLFRAELRKAWEQERMDAALRSARLWRVSFIVLLLAVFWVAMATYATGFLWLLVAVAVVGLMVWGAK